MNEMRQLLPLSFKDDEKTAHLHIATSVLMSRRYTNVKLWNQ